MAEQKQQQEDPGQAVKAQSMAEFEEKTKGKPTPTQSENDRAAMGEHVVDKEPDGSDEQPENSGPQLTREGHRAKTSEPLHTTQGGYQTRQTQPRPVPPSSSGSRSSE